MITKYAGFKQQKFILTVFTQLPKDMSYYNLEPLSLFLRLPIEEIKMLFLKEDHLRLTILP